MSTVEQIEKAVQSLSGPELEQFRAWFAAYNPAIEPDELARRAQKVHSSVKQLEAGHSRDGFEALSEIKQKISDRFEA